MRILLFSLLAISTIGLFAVPGAFADHLVISIDIAEGSSVPGCEETDDGCYILSTVVLSKADAQVTWYNTDNAAHTVTSGCLLYTSPSPRDKRQSRMPSSA